MSNFGSVADEYDAARPEYPHELFTALGPLRGRRVLDVGAGTGIASRGLRACGAEVVAVDTSREMLARARSRAPGLGAVVADGAVLPVRGASVDLVCFAQSWHWMPEGRRIPEVARVLRPGGLWAAWWSHARADGEDWFDRQSEILEAACPGVYRNQRDTDWGAAFTSAPMFGPVQMVVVPWTRHTDISTWLTELRSHSYVAALDAPRRDAVLRDVAGALRADSADGTLDVPYTTALWTAVNSSHSE
jgi:ubiquinone/menaquinone biosynthesis C-methylase UbiE